MKNILLTGATGFLGTRLLGVLHSKPDVKLTALVRNNFNGNLPCNIIKQDINTKTNWCNSLRGQDVIIHTASRTHSMNDKSIDPLSEYRRVNVEGTYNLAKEAIKADVKRFVFISSIKVNGERTFNGAKFSPDDVVEPKDFYAISKYEAELNLKELASKSNMQVVIIRPPLIYGPGVKGNFRSIIKIIEKGFPLPFGAVHNQRSLVALDNLTDLIIICLEHPNAADQIFLAGDGQDLSSTELFREISNIMGKNLYLLPVPLILMQLVSKLLNKDELLSRLTGDLQVDISKAQKILNWTPPISVSEGLRRCLLKE